MTAGGRSAGFGELTHGEKLTRTIPASVALTPAAEWKVAGTSRAQGQRPRDRHRRAQVCVRHEAARHAVRQGALSAVNSAPRWCRWTAPAAEAHARREGGARGRFRGRGRARSGYGRRSGPGRAEGRMEAGDGRGRQPRRIPVFQADRAGRRRPWQSEADVLHHRLYRPRAAGAARGGGRVGTATS